MTENEVIAAIARKEYELVKLDDMRQMGIDDDPNSYGLFDISWKDADGIIAHEYIALTLDSAEREDTLQHMFMNDFCDAWNCTQLI